MIHLKAKAKINLFFHITGKREDGYHLIESLNAFTNDIYDEIELIPAKNNSTEIVGGEFGGLLINEQNNLTCKALNLFSKDQKYKCLLTKNIPIGAGLGGGSADAAIIAKFLSTNISNAELAKIGADLPICYYNKPTYALGIGEIIEPVKPLPEIYLVVVNPRKELLTKAVFKDNTNINSKPLANRPSYFENANILVDFLKNTSNVLAETAIKKVPEIALILDCLNQQPGCYIARMSGSGPTCFGVFTERQQAKEAEKNIAQKYPEFWVKFSTI